MAITAADKAELATLADLDSRPTTPQRIARGAGQGAIGYTLVEFAQAFDMFGSDGWTAEQAAERWPAVTALVVVIAATIHNSLPAVGRFFTDWWQTRRSG